jgi:glycosyltransferase involved in cell wall biosynthesis
MPKVSVVMSVYNAELYLREAIESVLKQTYEDFEFIIVDDGSTDSSNATLEIYAKEDRRIRLVQNACNQGLIRSLNKVLKLTNGEYIARQDADDISLPQRLAFQVQFMDQHPEVGVVGTWMTNFDTNRRRALWKTPISDPLIRWSLLFSTSLAHPTVMIRRCLLEEGPPYRPEMLHVEDYDLWSRLSEKTRFANLPTCLYLRRIHEKQVSFRHNKIQEETVKAVMCENVRKLLVEKVSDTLVEQLRDAYLGKVLATRKELQDVVELLSDLYEAFLSQNELEACDRREIARDAAHHLTRIGFRHIPQRPMDAIRVLWKAIHLTRRLPLTTYIAEAFTSMTKS